MDVYAELVILDNAAITYLIARLTYRVCSMKPSKVRLFAAAIVGTAFALVYPITKSVALGWVTRAASYLTLCAILFAGKEKTVLPSLAFLSVTFCFGGAAFAVGFAIAGNAESALNARLSDIPIFAVVIGALVAYRIIRQVCATVKRRREIKTFVYDFSFLLYGEKLTFRGLIDTGNAIKSDGAGVVLVSADSLIKKLSPSAIVMFAKDKKRPRKRIVTASGDGEISFLPATDFVLYSDGDEHILYDVAVGASTFFFGERSEYDALLPPCIIGKITESEEKKNETEKIA